MQKTESHKKYRAFAVLRAKTEVLIEDHKGSIFYDIIRTRKSEY